MTEKIWRFVTNTLVTLAFVAGASGSMTVYADPGDPPVSVYGPFINYKGTVTTLIDASPVYAGSTLVVKVRTTGPDGQAIPTGLLSVLPEFPRISTDEVSPGVAEAITQRKTFYVLPDGISYVAFDVPADALSGGADPKLILNFYPLAIMPSTDTTVPATIFAGLSSVELPVLAAPAGVVLPLVP